MVNEIESVRDVPFPQLFDGVTVKVPLVVGVREMLLPDPEILPVPE